MLETYLRPRRRPIHTANASQLVFPQLVQSLDPRFFNPLSQHPFIDSEPEPPTTVQDDGMCKHIKTHVPLTSQ